MPHLEVEGRTVHFVHRRPVPAAGPPVVFLHGAGGTHQNWLLQVRDLASSPSYALDLPGHGRSAGPPRDSLAGYADWLVGFLDAAGLAGAVLVGHSMGGGVALEAALRHPARVAGLVLVASGARLRIAPAILDALRDDPDAAVGLICEWAYGPEAPPELVRLGRRQMGATPPHTLRGDLEACNAFDAMGRLGGVAQPALVLCGTQDRLTPVKFAAYLRDHLPRAQLNLVDGAGHMLMLEKPAALARALEAFLASIPSPPAAAPAPGGPPPGRAPGG